MASSATVYDNLSNFFGGMNGNLISSVVGERQYLKGINITCRGGVIRTRPGFEPIFLRFGNPADERTFTYGKWQGASIYHAGIGTYIMAGVSGNVFMIDPDNGTVINATATTGRLSELNDRLYFCQAERYFVVQDGINIPIILDGGTVARASRDANNIVPTGTIMAYGHGRLFIKISKGQFIAGDIYQPTDPQTVLKFTETTYLNGGGAFGVPAELGEITGMTFSQNFDSSDGQGPLVVMCQNGSDTFAVYNPRQYWADSDISRVQLRGVGSASQDSITVTGDDLFFRTYTGLGSYNLFKTSDRRYQDMSEELMPFEKQETQWARSLSSSVLFDNRILFTMVAEKVNAKMLDGSDIDDYRFKGLGVLDLAPLNGLTEVSKNRLSVYDGIWTGPHPLHIITGSFDNEPRCFVFGKNDAGEISLSELGTKPGNDCIGKRVNCRLYPRYVRFYAFPPGGNPVEQTFNFKRLDRAAMYVSSFQGDVDFKLWTRPDARCDFKKISELSIKAPIVDAEPPYTEITGGSEQARAKVTFPAFKDHLGDPVKGINVLNGYEYEFYFEWDGIAEIRRISLEATVQDRYPDFNPDVEKILPVSGRSDFDYSFSCQQNELGKQFLFSNGLDIHLGSYAFWQIGPTPGAIAIDDQGHVIPPNTPQTSPNPHIFFMQDPATNPLWHQIPNIIVPDENLKLPSEPPPPPPPGPTPPVPNPTPIPLQYPQQPVKVNPPIRLGPWWVFYPQQPVKVNPLPPPQDPPNNMIGALLQITCPAQVNRGDSFTVDLQLLKFVKEQVGTGITVYYQDWEHPQNGMTITLYLSKGNGDILAPMVIPSAWNEQGEMSVTVKIDGGSLPVNDTFITGTVDVP